MVLLYIILLISSIISTISTIATPQLPIGQWHVPTLGKVKCSWCYLNLKWVEVWNTDKRIWSYNRHETDTSRGVQTDGACAGSLKRESKSVHGLFLAEDNRVYHGCMEASRLLVFPANNSWVQLKGCLASQAKIYANFSNVTHLETTGGCVWVSQSWWSLLERRRDLFHFGTRQTCQVGLHVVLSWRSNPTWLSQYYNLFIFSRSKAENCNK